MIVGVDFGAPRTARAQRNKLVAVAASRRGSRSYRVDVTGLNARLFASAPGLSADELVAELLLRPRRVVGFDFPFCVPAGLLVDRAFAADAGHRPGAFKTFARFNAFVASRLPLTDPLDFSTFDAWRDPAGRARLWARRATDLAAGAQPPLKDRFQATFQMTLLGNAVLARLARSPDYRIVPFTADRGEGELIEVYPRATLRAMGLGAYKARPDEAARLAIAACAASNIELDVDDRVLALARNYSSGSPSSPDHDVADALVALATAILHYEGATRPALGPDATPSCRRAARREGLIWVPSTHPAAV